MSVGAMPDRVQRLPMQARQGRARTALFARSTGPRGSSRYARRLACIQGSLAAGIRRLAIAQPVLPELESGGGLLEGVHASLKPWIAVNGSKN